MAKNELTEQYRDGAGMLLCVRALTDPARPAADREAHTHYNELEIYYFVSGKLSFAFEGRRFPVGEGDMVIIADGQLHRPLVTAPCRYERRRILFNKNIFKQLSASGFEFYRALCQKRLLHIPSEAVSSIGLDRMYEEIEQTVIEHPPHGDFHALIALLSFLIKADRHSAEPIDTEPTPSSSKISEIVRYINQHLNEELTYKTLSRHFYLSEKSLYKLFKSETGFTLSDYVNERRIITAQSLMGSGHTACDAAAAVGYSDYSVFYRNFLKRVGVAPTEYARVNFTDGH